MTQIKTSMQKKLLCINEDLLIDGGGLPPHRGFET